MIRRRARAAWESCTYPRPARARSLRSPSAMQISFSDSMEVTMLYKRDLDKSLETPCNVDATSDGAMYMFSTHTVASNIVRNPSVYCPTGQNHRKAAVTGPTRSYLVMLCCVSVKACICPVERSCLSCHPAKPATHFHPHAGVRECEASVHRAVKQVLSPILTRH